MSDYRDGEGKFTTPISQIESRMGVTVTNRYGTKATIVRYTSATDMTIQYENGFLQKNNWRDFYKNKDFHSPLCRTVCGIGYLGEGIYTHSHPSKDMWTQMIHRVYNDKKLKSRPTYRVCSVSDEWHNFQNFAKWYDENYYVVEDCQMHLDKDILIKNNKVYSPSSCLVVPLAINGLVMLKKSSRGDFPIGVSLRKDSNQLRVHFTKSFFNGKKIKTKRFSFGQYSNEKDAFEVYKREKEKYIKEVADYYRSQITEKVYEALYRYEIDITD